jgi:hypothetical protein
MALSEERKRAIRERIKNEYKAPEVLRTLGGTLQPPDYDAEDFRPALTSVDDDDPDGKIPDATEGISIPRPSLPTDIDPGAVKIVRPYRCVQFPGEQFTATEACDRAGVPVYDVYKAVRQRCTIGGLFFYQHARPPTKEQIRSAKPIQKYVNGRNQAKLPIKVVSDSFPGEVFSVLSASRKMHVCKTSIFKAIATGVPINGVIFKKKDVHAKRKGRPARAKAASDDADGDDKR